MTYAPEFGFDKAVAIRNHQLMDAFRDVDASIRVDVWAIVERGTRLRGNLRQEFVRGRKELTRDLRA